MYAQNSRFFKHSLPWLHSVTRVKEKITKTCVTLKARRGRFKTFVKGSSVRRLRFQSYACLNISNMVSNMSNMAMSPCSSQPLCNIVSLE